MIISGVKSKQKLRSAWSKERLIHERALALGHSIDTSTWKNYESALNSYLNFVKLHDLPVNPTPDNLSFFTVFMSHHIKPSSVDTYLSGICQQLEPYFPNVRETRKSILVHRTLEGCKRLRGSPTSRKRALTIEDLRCVTTKYSENPSHDDLLFTSMLLTGFFGLMRLGELTIPDDTSLIIPRKVTSRSSLSITDSDYRFFLPSHKADKFFEGNTIIIRKNPSDVNPLHFFKQYLTSRDTLFPLSSELWLTMDGSCPSRSFFITCLRNFFSTDIGGQSMRAGGATLLAENGVAPHLIQATGRWASAAFQIYIRKNPTLLQALLYSADKNEDNFIKIFT